jgi:outer membrane protein OmpA-like peptidoglycan-associated protein
MQKSKQNRICTRVVLVLMLMLISQKTVAQQSTISNNLLYDATLTPNLRLGLSLSPHWSVGITGGYRPWPTSEQTSRKWRHLLVSPDVRYWTDSVSHRHFYGMNLIYSHYNVADVMFPFGLYKSVRDERRQGDLAALGLFYGYSWTLARNLRLEAIIGAAVGYTWFSSYKCGHCGMKVGDDQKVFAMPQAALNVVYNIPKRSRRSEYGTPAEVHVLPITYESDSVEVYQPELEQMPEPEPQQMLAETSHVEQLINQNPLLAPASEYGTFDVDKAVRKTDGALFVYYPVGKYGINRYYHGNGEVIDRIVSTIKELQADPECQIEKILIVGYASVDGGQWGNERLALNRANTLKKYLRRYVDVDDTLFDVRCGGEAWADLRDYLSDAEMHQAVEIIDKFKDPATREQRLRSLNGGRIWKKIMSTFRDHRNAGLIRIYLKEKQ